MSGRPLDVLEASLEEPVTVHLKDGTTYYGILAGYDQHMNIVIEPETDVDDRVDDDPTASSPSQSKTQRLYAAITSSPSKHDRLRNALSREKEQDGSREVPPLRREILPRQEGALLLVRLRRLGLRRGYAWQSKSGDN